MFFHPYTLHPSIPPTMSSYLHPNPCAFHRVLLSRAVRRLTLTPYSHPKPNPCTLHRVLPSRGVRRRTLTLIRTLTLTHTHRCSLHRVLRLTLTLTLRPRHPSIPPIPLPPLPPLFPCSRCCYNANAVLHPSIPPFTPLLAVACFRSPSLAHRCSLSVSLTRRRLLSVSLTRTPSLALGFLLRRLPVTTPIRLSISGYHADSTHRAPRRSFIHPG